MDISGITSAANVAFQSALSRNRVGGTTADTSFDTIFQTALNLVNETNEYQNAAESAEIQFALGEATSTHELQVAQEKANIALQYTVAVRDAVMEAYNKIMNMQI